MAVSEADLSVVLRHCRSLLDASLQLDSTRAGRGAEAVQTLDRWTGPYSEVFRNRLDDEDGDFRSSARKLRVEADAWARVWAATVNQINERRRADRIDQVSAGRGLGEELWDIVDVFHGDDSGGQVRAFVPVAVPTAATRYRATGGLETF